MPTILNWSQLGDEARDAAVERPAVRDDERIRETARDIVARVRREGDSALLALTRDLDKAALRDLRVADDEFAAAAAALPESARKAIDLAIRNVRAFHVAQVPAAIDMETMAGVRCQRISQPLDAVGLYVPAGTAPLPSAAIMLSVPAAIAGCPARIMCTPPRPDGTADPAVLIAAKRGGVDTVFKVGGAQAIAAMAYGTASIPRVNKIFGPGNAWVTAAKTLVAMDPGGAAIDMPAGPSEVLVIADTTANPEFVAADLLSQAEHGADSQVVLVSTSDDLVQRVLAEIEAQIGRLSRRAIASAALAHSRYIVAADIDAAIGISNRYAPEHLILHIAEPRRRLGDVRNAGSVFLGPWTPESVGDYCSGTNHVLPTYGAARSFSGLGVEQFMRHMTVQELTDKGLESLAPSVVELARLEGLDAHTEAVRCRLPRGAGESP